MTELLTCPLCAWQGNEWAEVRTAPSRTVAIACPRCSSYPRDRLFWTLLQRLIQQGDCRRVLEVGGRQRLSMPLRRITHYTNFDIQWNDAVDALLQSAKLPVAEAIADACLLSFVLCEVADASQRDALLHEMFRVIKPGGLCFIADDLDLEADHTRTIDAGDCFHSIRFGRDLLRRVGDAGFETHVLVGAPGLTGIGGSASLPIVVGSKGASSSRLKRIFAGLVRE